MVLLLQGEERGAAGGLLLFIPRRGRFLPADGSSGRLEMGMHIPAVRPHTHALTCAHVHAHACT